VRGNYHAFATLRRAFAALCGLLAVLALSMDYASAQTPPYIQISYLGVERGTPPDPFPEPGPYDWATPQPDEWDRLYFTVSGAPEATNDIWYYNLMVDLDFTMKNSVSSMLDWSWSSSVLGDNVYLQTAQPFSTDVEWHFNIGHAIRREFNYHVGLSFTRCEYTYTVWAVLMKQPPANPRPPFGIPPPVQADVDSQDLGPLIQWRVYTGNTGWYGTFDGP
jgi:hypothetical protein